MRLQDHNFDFICFFLAIPKAYFSGRSKIEAFPIYEKVQLIVRHRHFLLAPEMPRELLQKKI